MDAEEFLEQLQDCSEGIEAGYVERLRALPSVLSKRAARWYYTVKATFGAWEEFLRAFKHQYVGTYDREDLIDDLRRRTQGTGEKISDFLASFRYIL